MSDGLASLGGIAPHEVVAEGTETDHGKGRLVCFGALDNDGRNPGRVAVRTGPDGLASLGGIAPHEVVAEGTGTDHGKGRLVCFGVLDNDGRNPGRVAVGGRGWGGAGDHHVGGAGC